MLNVADHLSISLDILRGVAICAVILENWLLFVPGASSIFVFQEGVNFVQNVAGTMVHLFLILSGYGLTLSFYKNGSFTWSTWIKKRFVRVVFPYLVIVTLIYFIVVMLYRLCPSLFTKIYSWTTLLAYLTFLRNFYGPGSGFNPTLWFMPVIIGLYALFPFLVFVLRKKGPCTLLIVSGLLTYISITICLLTGYPVTHNTALPFFFVIEFALGMILAFVVTNNNESIHKLMTFKMFCAGIFFYALSWAMRALWDSGDVYNDFFTAIGVLLITLYPCYLFLQVSNGYVVSALRQLSNQSYLMYLLHGFLIIFVVKPLLGRAGLLPLNPAISLICAILYCCVMFVLASLISKPLNYLMSLLFQIMIKKDMSHSTTIRLLL